jgi:hypothetical protein
MLINGNQFSVTVESFVLKFTANCVSYTFFTHFMCLFAGFDSPGLRYVRSADLLHVGPHRDEGVDHRQGVQRATGRLIYNC